jgi:hypothetical protein
MLAELIGQIKYHIIDHDENVEFHQIAREIDLNPRFQIRTENILTLAKIHSESSQFFCD